MTPLFVHVGYPKTATTTFQTHLFPHHPEVDYLGKFIPSHRYRDECLFSALGDLMTADECRFEGVAKLRKIVNRYRNQSSAKVMLISSESFLHVTATDIGVVAQRIKAAFSPCKIIITIREQLSMIQSFYGLHGRFGQYLFLTKSETEKVDLPLSIDQWLSYEFRAYNQNFLSTLHYYDVIKYYVDVFGNENVGVFLFECFVTDKRSYLEEFCGFLDVDVKTSLDFIEGRHELPNLSSRELAFYRFMSKYVPERNLPRATVIRTFLRNSPRASVEIDSVWRDKIKELYGQGNHDLARDFSLPLQQFGYL